MVGYGLIGCGSLHPIPRESDNRLPALPEAEYLEGDLLTYLSVPVANTLRGHPQSMSLGTFLPPSVSMGQAPQGTF